MAGFYTIAFCFFTCAIASEHQACSSASGDGACQAGKPPADVYAGSNLLQQARRSVKLTRSDAVPCAELEGKTLDWQCHDDSRDSDPELCRTFYIERDGEQKLCVPKVGSVSGEMKLCIASDDSLQALGQCSPTQGCLLPLGDHVTQAYVGRTGYRYRLWKKLVDEGIFFEWVGTVTEPADKGWEEDYEPPSQDELNPDYKNYTFPRQNEGHSEWPTDELASHLGGWLSNYSCQPTCALVDVGTADMWQGKDVNTTLKDIQTVLDTLKSSGSDPTILLAVPTPICGKPEHYSDLLTEIPTLGDPDQKIHIVNLDPEGTFSFKNDCFDWCNPNDSGEEKIATQFLEAVKQYCV